MAHNHPIRDDEKRFIIDAVTKTVLIPENASPVLIQHDHNSEHITFECDRFVEGHDLMLCDKVEIHYNNLGGGNRKIKGVYPVADLRVSDSDNSKIVFTWVVSMNATTYNGQIFFVVSFTCTDEGDILYRWNTNIYKGLPVAEGIDNGEAVEGVYADVLEAWRLELFGIGDTIEGDIRRIGQNTIASIPVEYSDLHAKVDNVSTIVKLVVKTSNLYNVNEFDENGYYIYNNGVYASDMSEYGSSGFIEVKENIKYSQNSGAYITFWDSDKNFISGQNGGWSFITPSGCKYVNCALLKSIKYAFVLMEYGEVNYAVLDSEVDRLSDYFSFETNNLYDSRFVGYGCYDLEGNFANVDDYGSFTIAVTEGETYVKNWGGYVAYFDSANNWITTDVIQGNTNFVVPANAVKMNVAVLRTSTDFWLVPAGETYYKKLVSEFLPATLSGLKYGALGDSITAGYAANTCYGNILSDSESISFVNYGISGNRIADSDENSTPMYIRYADMSDDLDIITVFGGTNDYASQTPIGTNDDITGSTFKGALNILCRGLTKKYVGKRIGFMTPIKRNGENSTIKLCEYCEAIKEVCSLYGIPVLDLYNTSTISCIDHDNSNGLLVDGLHPSDAGHVVLARKISSFIKTL